MPPAQCPECGRFLKRSLVTGLAEAPAPCPGCGAELRADMFASAPVVDAANPESATSDTAPAAAAAVDEAASDGDEASVRPPDLVPQTVRDDTSDVLAGWDVGAGPDEVARWRDDTAPFPIDAAVVLGFGAAGMLAGWAVGRDGRLRSALAGAVAGAVAASVARRVWRLDG